MRPSSRSLSVRSDEQPGHTLTICNIHFELLTTSERGRKEFPDEFTPRRYFMGGFYLTRCLIVGGSVGLAAAIFRSWTVAAGWGLAAFGVCAILVFLLRYVERLTYNNQNREAFEREQRFWKASKDDWMAAYLTGDLEEAITKLKSAANAYVRQHANVMKLRQEVLEQILVASQQNTKLAHLLIDGVLLQFWEQAEECTKSINLAAEMMCSLTKTIAMHDAALNAVMGEIDLARNIPITHSVAGGVHIIGSMRGEAVGDLCILPEWVVRTDDVNRELRRVQATYAELINLAQVRPEFVAVLQRRKIQEQLELTRETIKQEFRILASTITSVEAKLNAKIEDATARLEAASRASTLLVTKAVQDAASRISARVSWN